MRTVKAQCVWDDEYRVWCVFTEPGIGAVSQAWTVNGARQACREAVDFCLMGGEPFELDFQVRRWFDDSWPSSEDAPHRRRRREAQLNDLARAAQSGGEGAIDAFLEARRRD